MITLDKLRIFNRYKGDLDMFVRTGRARDKQTISDDDRYLIDLLLQDATVLTRELGSAERNPQATKRIRENGESDDVVQQVHALARRL